MVLLGAHGEAVLCCVVHRPESDPMTAESIEKTFEILRRAGHGPIALTKNDVGDASRPFSRRDSRAKALFDALMQAAWPSQAGEFKPRTLGVALVSEIQAENSLGDVLKKNFGLDCDKRGGVRCLCVHCRRAPFELNRHAAVRRSR